MKIKICGMREAQNIQEALNFQPAYLGFIFYEKSKRFVGEDFKPNQIEAVPKSTKKVAVFVNEKLEKVVKIYSEFAFDFVQLHGDETASYCKTLKEKGVHIIKVFSIDDEFDFSKTKAYKPFLDYFLFDTKGIQYGGNGFAFDWEVLKNYDNEIPFFLSGGIGLENINEALKLKELNIEALDLNSKLEVRPGLKDIELIEKIENIRIGQ